MLQEHAAKVREAAARLRRQLAALLPPATASDNDTNEDGAFVASATKITALLRSCITSLCRLLEQCSGRSRTTCSN
jgi:hypothetical protein